MKYSNHLKYGNFLRDDEFYVCAGVIVARQSRKPVVCSWLRMTEYSVSMWHILSSAGCCSLHMVHRKKYQSGGSEE